MLACIKSGVRVLLRRFGYDIRSLTPQSYGIDYVVDIDRLARAWTFPLATFFDVGAHQGETTKRVLLSFPNLTVIAFEPHPKSFAVLRQQFAQDRRVATYNVALDRQQRTASLFDYRDNSYVSSLAPDARYASLYETQVSTISVPCTTLDYFCEQNGISSVDVLKIDTEGFELKVLQGASAMLARQGIRFIYLEFNDMLEIPGITGGALVPIAKFLGPFGFRFVATYTDYIRTDGEMFGVSNALFALPPHTAIQQVGRPF
jgi:FkbM family methyltransferase